MSAFTYLPGFIANTVDGGMASPSAPTTKLTLVLGTAGQGPANVAYPVTDPATAAADYGLAGDLILGMEEVRAYCDNIVLYRLGTKQGTLTGVGLDNTAGATAPGYNIALGEVAATAPTDYSIWYNNDVLYIWLKGSLVYAHDVANGIALDTGDCTVTGGPGLGLELGAGADLLVSGHGALIKTCNTLVFLSLRARSTPDENRHLRP